MRHITLASLLTLLLLTSLTACKSEKKAEEDIIVEKVIAKPQTTTESMTRDERAGDVTWVGGAQYHYTIVREADSELDVVENHGKKYHDNSVTLTVTRPDGSEFFKKTFTKANFAPVLPEASMKNGVMLGMVLEKASGNNLRFVVSVGSPDESYEDFYYVIMNLNNFGSTSAERYSVSDADDGRKAKD